MPALLFCKLLLSRISPPAGPCEVRLKFDLSGTAVCGMPGGTVLVGSWFIN